MGDDFLKETLQETADRLKNFPGNVKGEVFRTHADYIEHKEGKEGVKKVEEKMKELGIPIRLRDIKPFEWISEGWSSLTILVAKEVFDWSDEDVFEMGRFAPRFSFIIKVMMQYLVSIDSLFENASKYWEKNYDFGSFDAISFDKKQNKVIVREKGFKTHPTICVYHAGYFKGLTEFVIKTKNISITETKCVHRGADYNEFLIEWN